MTCSGHRPDTRSPLLTLSVILAAVAAILVTPLYAEQSVYPQAPSGHWALPPS